MKLLAVQVVMTSTAIVGLYNLGYAPCTAQTVIGVGTCEELQHAVDLVGSSGDTSAVLAPGGVSCVGWTTFEIENNRFQLVAQEDEASLGKHHVYAFENVRFLVWSGGLGSDVALSFTTGADNKTQEVDGGVLNVAQGAYAHFESAVFMNGITIESVPREEGSNVTSDKWFGGCVYNQGSIRFEEYLQVSNCATVGGGASVPGNGGGVFNGKHGDIVFKRKAKFADCGTTNSKGNRGGAIYNEGKITLFKTSKFFDNVSAAGGAIFNEGEMNFVRKYAAKFRGNRSYGDGNCQSGKDDGRYYSGGQVLNTGSMVFEGGVLFEGGQTQQGFGGAIANYGSVIIKTSASFQNNVAGCMGGAISSPSNATFELLQDARFQDNKVAYDEAMCENWVEVAATYIYPEVVRSNHNYPATTGMSFNCRRDTFD